MQADGDGPGLSIDLQIAGYKEFDGWLVRGLAAPVSADDLESVRKRVMLPHQASHDGLTGGAQGYVAY